MLEINIGGEKDECWDESKGEFVYIKEQTLRLEHSLVSISKWESKWCKPFFSKNKKTIEEENDYIRCMTLNQNVDPRVYNLISDEKLAIINAYIESPMSATTINRYGQKNSIRNEKITSEVIYFWMITYNIPFECKKWHINRLLTLIEVCNIKNSPQKKMSERELMSRNAALNAARKQQLNTKG